MGGLAATLSRSFEPSPAMVSQARRLVREALTSVDRADLLDMGELLISEVVTNALVHAGTPVQVAVTAGGDGLRAEVSDGSRQLPALRTHTALAGTGRGLHMLEQLVDSWGVQVRGGGKTVWFVLTSGGGPEEPLDLFAEALGSSMDLDVEERRSAHRGHRVVLLDVPLLLHDAWQVHSESMLREYLLVRLDDDVAVDGIEEHAAAHQAMALLRDQIPAPQLGEHPAALMASAVEPGVSAERLVLEVPVRAVPSFAALDVVLDAALALADAGELLTPPTQPEMRVMRRWLCSEVDRQATGAAPIPWRLASADLRVPETTTPLSWDASTVRDSDRALVAADDTDTIVAVSRPAAELLGHPSPRALEGRRLVELIPPRYRQAHLAGFTLHLFAGRDPLIGRRVTVPVRRDDGTELTAELVVEAVPTPDGRRAFVAEFWPAGGAA